MSNIWGAVQKSLYILSIPSNTIVATADFSNVETSTLSINSSTPIKSLKCTKSSGQPISGSSS